jgi:hypothetical protein
VYVASGYTMPSSRPIVGRRRPIHPTANRRLHSARTQRGETFALAATAMAESRVVPGWGDRKRYLRATRALLACGLIERVEGSALQYWIGSDGKARCRGKRAAQ